jgi:dihydrofolate synthase/folylpolyglutamate synthase
LVNYEKKRPIPYGTNNFSPNRMGKILALLGNPHREVRMIHIAGTKGKGSTATMLSRMLEKSGYKVGLYTSPHLITVRERISIDGEMIGETEFGRLARKLVVALGKQEPTYFEALTAIAFCYFAEQKCDLAVIETGIGGRLDSTNVIKPLACGVTTISYDHTGQLGKSLASIAKEKAGIFKSGVPVVSAPQVPEVKRVLKKAAEESNSPLKVAGDDYEYSIRFESARPWGPHTRLSMKTPTSRYEHLHVPLLGEHQAINCGLALGLLDTLKDQGLEIDDQKAMAGLSGLTLAGRMEIISDDPRILVDGAHNASSMEALMRAIGQNIPYDSMVVIFGCAKDKDIPGLMRFVQLGADKVIFTTAGTARSMDPEDLAAAYAEVTGKMSQVAHTLDDAMAIACRAISKDDLITITGSFYLVGLAKQQYQKI